MHCSNLKWVLASVGLLSVGAQASVLLGTSNPMATPLTMAANTTSGAMFINIISDNPPNDVMAGWIIELTIVPDAGATGTLTFQDPTTGTPSNPTNYLFGSNGLGILAINTGNQLSANDFFVTGLGASVPGNPGSNLLQVDFLASPGASGSFGIYAVEGADATTWFDSNFSTQFFTNVPSGSGTVLIGDVVITPAPDPLTSTFAGCSIGLLFLAGRAWRQRRGAAVSP